MAIYDLFENEMDAETIETEAAVQAPTEKSQATRFFSGAASRVTFALLLLLCLGWFLLSFTAYLFTTILKGISFGKLPIEGRRALLNVRRSLACGLGLSVGLVSPSFGVMVTCTYFMMYDKEGIDEVIPAPFRNQFKELFKS